MNRILLAVAFLCLSSGAAMAQDAGGGQTPPPPPAAQPSVPPNIYREVGPMSGLNVFWTQARSQRFLESLEEGSRYMERQPADRRARASRLAAMANGGQCRQAVQVAHRERDADMAYQLQRLCRRDN